MVKTAIVFFWTRFSCDIPNVYVGGDAINKLFCTATPYSFALLRAMDFDYAEF